MKVYNISKRMSKSARERILSIIATHDKYKKCYLWISSGNAASRRYREKMFFLENKNVQFITEKRVIEVEFAYSESCKNIYYSLRVIVDDEKKDIRLLKKLLKQ